MPNTTPVTAGRGLLSQFFTFRSLSSNLTKMRAGLGLIVFLLCLVLFTPFVYASTFEVWTDGLYDAESDEVVQVLRSAQVVEAIPLTVVHVIDIVVEMLSLGDERAPEPAVAASRSARAPPAS
jgi:hypothetical protein